MPHHTTKQTWSARREWTGKPEPRWVLRFRGHPVITSTSRHDCLAAARSIESEHQQ